MARPDNALAMKVSPENRAWCRVVRTNAHIMVDAIKTENASATTVGTMRTVRCKFVPRVEPQALVQAMASAGKTSCAVVRVDGADLLVPSFRAQRNVNNMAIV